MTKVQISNLSKGTRHLHEIPPRIYRKYSNQDRQMCIDVGRGVARGGPGGGECESPPEFGRSVNPIQIRGADYAPHTAASPTGFKMLSTPLYSVYNLSKSKSVLCLITLIQKNRSQSVH